MQSGMNKNMLRKLVAAGIAALVCGVSVVQAAPTLFRSDHYAVESVIFGGTGILRSAEGSIPPLIVGTPTVTAITISSATVNWQTDKPTNGVVTIGTTSGTYPIQTGNIVDATATIHTITLNLLTKATTYYYRVRSTDIAGNLVVSSEFSFLTDAGDITPPVVMSGPDIATNSASSIIITWQTNKLSNTVVEYGTHSVSENTAGQPDERTQFHQVQLSNLLPTQKYLLRVKSRDISDNLYTGAVFEYTTLSSPAISEVKISDITLVSAVIQWKTSSSTNSTINYGTSSTYGQQFKDLTTFSLNHIARLTGLTSGTVYHLRISAEDQSSNQLRSDEYSFKTIVLPIVSNFAISAVTSGGAVLTWKTSADTNEFVRYSAVTSPDKSVVGKLENRANDKLVGSHRFELTDLISSTEYAVTVFGNDVFGNQSPSATLVFTTLIDSTPPVIENIKSDTTVDLGSKQSVQILVSFGLNELGTAILEYGDGAGGGGTTYDHVVKTDIDPSRNKFMVIPGLEPGNSYHFHIVATDLAGNKTKSADYLALAPSKSVSLLDLIFGQLKDNFAPLFNLSK